MEGAGQVELRAKRWRTVADVKASVARRYKVKVADLESPCRKPQFTRPRQIAMALAVRRLQPLGYSTPQIGRAFGGRDHATVLFACRKFDARYRATVKPFRNDKPASPLARRFA